MTSETKFSKNGNAVSETLAFELDWERLDLGSPEERATFAAIGIKCNEIWLTEAEDAFVRRVRQKVHLSAYPLAEWFAWNWWRLRWEPNGKSLDWAMAHKMSTIGGGYVWPNITVISDGERIVLAPRPTAARPNEPLRYICQVPVVVPATAYETAVDLFVEQVLGQLEAEGIRDTNLKNIWHQVRLERSEPELSRRRIFEALLGNDPDEADEKNIERLIRDSVDIGENGMRELAAARIQEDAATIKDIAARAGFDSSPKDAVRLHDKSRDSLPTSVAAWKRGVAAARSLREQENLKDLPVSNNRLCELAGVASAALKAHDKIDSVSFALDKGLNQGRVVLRSRYETGRRFDLARLLGDRVAALSNGALKPATRSHTFRQKLQRAFAGELLCPFEALAVRLHGDLSDEAIQEAAEHFNVSVLTVQTLLANHGMIEREDLLDALESAA